MKAKAIELLDCHPWDSQCWDRAGLGPFMWAWVLGVNQRRGYPFRARTVLTTAVT